jgi:hypothetical protein
LRIRPPLPWFISVFLLSTLPVSGQTTPLAEALVSARYTLTVGANGFSGAGARVLANAIDQAQFVAIGEDHLTREIPLFTAHVCDQMSRHGLDAIALEIGTEAARFAQSTLGRPNRVELMEALQRKYPDSIAFVSDKQENDLLEHCFESAKQSGFQVWGLDQEFVGAAGWLIQTMIDSGSGPKTTAALETMQKDERACAADATRSGELTRLYLFTSTDEQIAVARAAIETDGTPGTLRLFNLLAQSRTLYQQHRVDFRASNGARARLLKQNLLRRYIAAATNSNSPPRVLLKFGDTHLYKGFNELHELNLGNLLPELSAAVGGAGSLHILVLGVSGVHAMYGGYGQSFAHAGFVMDQDKQYTWLTPAVKAANQGSWTLYDLRQLRFDRVAELDRDWERVVYGYDLLVLIPQITPADLLE